MKLKCYKFIKSLSSKQVENLILNVKLYGFGALFLCVHNPLFSSPRLCPHPQKIVLPRLVVLYATLADTWGSLYSIEISVTIMALDVFLNALLVISTANYYKNTYSNVDENRVS